MLCSAVSEWPFHRSWLGIFLLFFAELAAFMLTGVMGMRQASSREP